MALSGGLVGDEERWSTFSTSADLPAAEVIRTGRRLVVSGRDAILARFSDVPARGLETLVALPLGSGDDVIGSITLSFTESRHLEEAEVEFLDILSSACAQSIGRIAAQREAAHQRAKLEFLAQAATELASSLDYQATLARVARLAVPTFADWCAIDLVDDGRLRRLSVAHVDPAKVQLAHDLAERYPADPDAAHGAWQVMRTGRSELIAEITDDMLTAGAVDAEHAEIARALHLRSAVTVPLVARGRVLGVMTWVAAESERHYTPDDLALAEELAQRAAVSLDNADLHSQTLAAAVQLQRAVLPDALPAAQGWELAHHYSPAGRTEVGGDFYDVIEREDGRLVLFIGDVMGRGVAAAAAMAHVRAAVRAYAALDPRPQVVLAHLDQMFDHYGSEQLVTLLYLLVDPGRDEARIGNAGHPPPVLLRADGTLVELPLPTDRRWASTPGARRDRRGARGAGHGRRLHRRPHRTPRRGHHRGPGTAGARRAGAARHASGRAGRVPGRAGGGSLARRRHRGPRRASTGLTRGCSRDERWQQLPAKRPVVGRNCRGERVSARH